MRLAVLDGLANRMSAYMDDANLVIATLLDPRYKTTFFSHLSENEQNKVVKSLVKEVEWLLDDGSVADSASEDGDAGPPGDSMAGMLAEYAAKVTPAEPRRKRMREEVNSKQVAEVQVAEYVNDKPINFDADPMDYWRLNGEKWPALRMLARKFLSAPAGSIESERLFSTAGHIVSKLRKKLLPRNVENLLFVHHNVPIYGFGKW